MTTELASMLFFGALLALAHATIPNHWLPVVVLAKTYRWTKAQMVRVAVLAGGAHVASTILIGVLVGLLGKLVTEHYRVISHYGAPAVLAGLGLALLGLDLAGRPHHHHHGPGGEHEHDHGEHEHGEHEHEHEHGHHHPHHHHGHGEHEHGEHGHCEHEHEHEGGGTPLRAFSIGALALSMFLSPCVELETYYIQAGKLGWLGIATLSAVYLTLTVAGIVFLVLLFSAGYRRVKWDFLERHERGVAGAVLLAAAVAMFFLGD